MYGRLALPGNETTISEFPWQMYAPCVTAQFGY